MNIHQVNRVCVWLALVLCLPVLGAQGERADACARNPLLWADVPDIAIIRVGESYYMSSTTMHLSPGLPIMKSRDLVNWQLIGYAYDTLGDNDALTLQNGKNAYGAGSWASSLRYHDGTFYVTTFSSTTGKTHIYRTKDIEKGEWTATSFSPSLHDHSLVFDDDGRVYMIYGGGNLRLVELNPDLSGLKPGGINEVVITNATAVAGPNLGLPAEGSQMRKINGKYYLFNITWPRGGMRTVIVHRADKILGPYEGRVALQDKGVAQGGLIDTPQGDWYAYLFRDSGAVGRIPYLVPAKWVDGWPVLGVDGKVPDALNLPASTGLIPGIVASDEFERRPGEPALPLVWQWNHNPDNRNWSLTARPGFLRLVTGRVDPDFLKARNTLTQRTIGPECSGATTIDVSSMKDGDFAGLALLQTQYGLVGVKRDGGTNFIVMVSAKSGSPVEVQTVGLSQTTVGLKAECNFKNLADVARFSYSLDGKSWIPIGNELKMTYTLPHFMGYRFGLFNYATRNSGGFVDFDYFRISQSGNPAGGARAVDGSGFPLRDASAAVVLLDGGKANPASIKVERDWKGPVCTATLKNTGTNAVRVARVDLFDFNHGLPGDTPFYAESFQMLAQNGGTLARPQDWGSYPDRSHYRLAEPENLRTGHGMMLLRPPGMDQVLLGFASCRRFDGRISFDATRLLVSLDCEGLELAPGESWDLEEFFLEVGPERETLLADLCRRIEKNHRRRAGFKAPPVGWCSWYCFGPKVTVADIRQNLDWIATNAPQLRYIQIDDGYQPWMGDWLETGKSFGGDIKAVLREIRQRGFEPAIWVAPFVASPQSKLFREHPDWFMKGEDGKPLRSDQVGFGGWRLGPWYALDGTHPEAQKFLESTFRAMRQDWGCTYFKLDANYWGALHQSRFHDPRATRIEAYRRGMAAVLRGAGDAFILGCNHPLWPSLGLLDGSRSSMDISRDWPTIRDIGRQNLLRGWQNGRFWWNDPDCVLLSPGRVLNISGEATGNKGAPLNEVIFHATTVHATGGMLLSGDHLPTLSPERLALFRRLIPPTGHAARFADETLAVGRAPHGDGEFLYLFNWGDQAAERVVKLPRKVSLKNYWTGESLGQYEGEYRVSALSPHTALLLEASPTQP